MKAIELIVNVFTIQMQFFRQNFENFWTVVPMEIFQTRFDHLAFCKSSA